MKLRRSITLYLHLTLFSSMPLYAEEGAVHSIFAPAYETQSEITSDLTKKTLIVGSEFDYPPFALVTEKGEADGYSVDLIKAVAEAMGLTIKFRVGPWNDVRTALEKGEIDMLPLVGYTKERDKLLDFTTPHTVVYDSAFIRKKEASRFKSMEDLKSKEVIVMQSDNAHDYALATVPKNLIFPTETNPAGLQLLASGKHDYALMPKLMGLIIIKDLKLDNLQAVGTPIESYQHAYCFAVTEGNIQLLSRLNDGLSIIKASGEYDKIYDKWFGAIDPRTTSWETILKYVGATTAVSLTIIFIVFLWSFSLRKQVAQRTKELQQEIVERKHIQVDLERAKEAADSANHAKSVFLANMSHELRTPLNGILGYAQILGQDKMLNAEQKEGITVIQRSGEYLLTLITDVLDISKIESGRIELYPIEFYLEDFLRSITRLFQMRAQQKGIGFSFEAISPLPLAIVADDKRLRQILLNLLSNAVKFTQQGNIVLKVGYQNGKMLFKVEDTGIGISTEDLDKIFLPFQQAGDPNYRAEGTGLGLSITQKLVEMMGGTLSVESVLGRGSTFWTELDIHEAVGFEAKSLEKGKIIGFQKPLSALPSWQGYTLLTVDDNKQNLSILINLLSPLGFKIERADSGQEAISKARDTHPDLILMDLMMPGIDGYEATHQIRKIPELKDTPIIAISAGVFDYHRQKSLKAGCNDFIPKPVRNEELFACLKKYLSLEWLYESTISENAKAAVKPSNFLGSVLTREQINTLYDLSRKGDITSILKVIVEFERTHISPDPFTSKIRQLAEDFETKAIDELIEHYLETQN